MRLRDSDKAEAGGELVVSEAVLREWWEGLPLIGKSNIIDYKFTNYAWSEMNGTDRALIQIARKKRIKLPSHAQEEAETIFKEVITNMSEMYGADDSLNWISPADMTKVSKLESIEELTKAMRKEGDRSTFEAYGIVCRRFLDKLMYALGEYNG